MKKLILLFMSAVSPILYAAQVPKSVSASMPVQKRVANVIGTLALSPVNEEEIKKNVETADSTINEVLNITLPLLETLQKYQVIIWNTKGPVLENPEVSKIIEEHPTINMLAPVAGFLNYTSPTNIQAFVKNYNEAMERMRGMKQETDLAKAIVSVNAVMDIIHANISGDGKLRPSFFTSTEAEEKFNQYLENYLNHISQSSLQ